MPSLSLSDIPRDLYDQINGRAFMNDRTFAEELVHIVQGAIKPLTAEEAFAVAEKALNNSPNATLREDVLLRICRGGRQ